MSPPKAIQQGQAAWRASGGARRSLGWVPFKTGALNYGHGQVRFNGRWFSLWDGYRFSRYDLRAGNFSEEARGRGYLNVTVKVPVAARSEGCASVGIDLGMKDFAATSDGQVREAQRFCRRYEAAIGKAQRPRKTKSVAALHAKEKTFCTSNPRHSYSSTAPSSSAT